MCVWERQEVADQDVGGRGGQLHEARFERGPVVEDTEFWERMPTKRKETFWHLPLEQEGAEGIINESVITRAHDCALPLRL